MTFQDLINSLGQRFSNNLDASNKVIDDSTKQSLDRMKMTNPNIQGPPLPNSPTNEDMKLADMYGQGMMGAVAPGAKVIAKSAPYMQNITKEAVDAAVPVGEGLANNGNEVMKRFLELKQKLNKRY